MQRLNGQINTWLSPVRQFGDELSAAYRGGDIPLLVLIACQCVAVAYAQEYLVRMYKYRNAHRVNCGDLKKYPDRYIYNSQNLF